MDNYQLVIYLSLSFNKMLLIFLKIHRLLQSQNVLTRLQQLLIKLIHRYYPPNKKILRNNLLRKEAKGF